MGEKMFANQSQLEKKWREEIHKLREQRKLEKGRSSSRMREIDNMIDAYAQSIAKLTRKGFSKP